MIKKVFKLKVDQSGKEGYYSPGKCREAFKAPCEEEIKPELE